MDDAEFDKLKEQVFAEERQKQEKKLKAFADAIAAICEVHKADIHSEPTFIMLGNGTFAVGSQTVYKLRKETYKNDATNVQ